MWGKPMLAHGAQGVHAAVSVNCGGLFCGCPHNKRLTVLGMSVLGSLIFGKFPRSCMAHRSHIIALRSMYLPHIDTWSLWTACP